MADSNVEVQTQTTTVNPDGSTTTRTVIPKQKDPNAPETAEDLGFSAAFLKEHPDIKAIVDQALKEDWPQAKFNRVVETETKWGKRLTASQEAFDLQMAGGPQKADYEKQIQDQIVRVKDEAAGYGVSLSDSEITNIATKIVRNQIPGVNVRLMIGKKFEMPTNNVATGDAAMLADNLKSIAGDYGITLTASDLERRVRAGITAGTSPAVYAEQQRAYFRDQAKNLYPSISEQLNNYSVRDILNPYLSTASELLGVNVQNMNLDDERWIRPLNNAQDAKAPMTMDQWRTTLRTDDKYGYGKTSQALNEAVDLGNQIISIMGAV